MVPDVVGMGLIDAVYVLEKLGLLVQPVGSGIVRKQSVKAGYRINKGQKIILQLDEIIKRYHIWSSNRRLKAILILQ